MGWVGCCQCSLLRQSPESFSGIDVNAKDEKQQTVMDLLVSHPSARTREIGNLIYGEFSALANLIIRGIFIGVICNITELLHVTWLVMMLV